MDNLMLSKAAMYTMLTVMTEAAGVAFDELEPFFIAGAFGAYVAADKAVTIGMVPDIPLERYRLLGNSSLEGAKRVLLSVDALEADRADRAGDDLRRDEREPRVHERLHGGALSAAHRPGPFPERPRASKTTVKEGQTMGKNAPTITKLEPGTYHWCSCGKSGRCRSATDRTRERP